MSLPQTIEHRGVVQSVREHDVTVRVMQSAACSSCAAANMCRSGENRARQINVSTTHASDFHAGDSVILTATVKQSRMAVLLAYVVPLLGLLAVLFVAHELNGNDGFAALMSLFFVAFYYVILYCFRGRLSKDFLFEVLADDGTRKIENN